MKKIILSLLFISSISFAQNGINYQGAATDADGAKLVNQNISLKTSVLQGGVDGTTSYSEIHNTTTDQFGLFNVVIGQGVSISGDFETISWGSDDHFLKVELDATGGTNYNLVSTTQMMSVPYALYAKNAGLDSAAVADMLASMNISGNSDVQMTVSTFGDTLTIGNQSVIIPGISYENTPDSLFGTVTDINLNTYQTVKLGDQEWMTEHLKATNFSNGENISLQTASIDCNIPSMATINGVSYYNGNAVLDSRNICPVGWRIPSKQDYEILLEFFGGTQVSETEWSNVGEILKSTKSSGSFAWNDGGNVLFVGNNNSHLNIDATGMMYCSSSQVYYATEGHLYTTDQQTGSQFYLRVSASDHDVRFNGHSGYPSNYLSPCRCLKD